MSRDLQPLLEDSWSTTRGSALLLVALWALVLKSLDEPLWGHPGVTPWVTWTCVRSTDLEDSATSAKSGFLGCTQGSLADSLSGTVIL